MTTHAEKEARAREDVEFCLRALQHAEELVGWRLCRLADANDRLRDLIKTRPRQKEVAP